MHSLPKECVSNARSPCRTRREVGGCARRPTSSRMLPLPRQQSLRNFGCISDPLVACRALPPIEVDSATVVSVLKGPTLSEMLGYGKTALGLAGAAWQAAIAPFAIFGTDRWGLNLMFYFAVIIMGYNLIVQSPKQ